MSRESWPYEKKAVSSRDVARKIHGYVNTMLNHKLNNMVHVVADHRNRFTPSELRELEYDLDSMVRRFARLRDLIRGVNGAGTGTETVDGIVVYESTLAEMQEDGVEQ